MYKWLITYALRSGKVCSGIYEGPENQSTDVAMTLLKGNENTFNGIRGMSGTSNLLVRNRDISAIEIEEYKESKNAEN